MKQEFIVPRRHLPEILEASDAEAASGRETSPAEVLVAIRKTTNAGSFRKTRLPSCALCEQLKIASRRSNRSRKAAFDSLKVAWRINFSSAKTSMWTGTRMSDLGFLGESSSL